MAACKNSNVYRVILFGAALCLLCTTMPSALAYDHPRDHGHQHRVDPDPPDDDDVCHDTCCADGAAQNEPCDECTSTGSPVVLPNGNLVLHFADLHFEVEALERTYNSRDARTGTMGNRWVSNIELQAIPVTDGQDRAVLIRWPSGHRHRFVQQPDGSYAGPLGNRLRLSKEASGELVLTTGGGGKRYEFDPQGTLQRVLDRNGNALEFAYDLSTGCLDQVSGPGGRGLAVTRAANGMVGALTDHAGRTVQYEYDSSGNLISVTDPLGNVTTYTYDGLDRLTGVFDPLGRQTVSVTYDAEDRVSRLIDKDGDFSYLYDQDVEPPWPTDPNLSIGATASSNSVYSSSYAPSKAIDGNTGTYYISTRWPGDAWLQIDFPAPVTVEQIELVGYSGSYTTSGTLLLSNGYEEPFVQSGGTDVFDIPDQDGITWVRFYATTIDYYYFVVRELRVFGIAPPPGPVVKTKKTNNDTSAIWGYAFDNRGVITAIIDPLQNVTTRTYDADYNLIGVTDANGNTTSYTYDADKNVISETDPLGNTIHYTYNTLGLVETVTDPLGVVTRYEYDANGHRTALIEDAGGTLERVTAFEYDGLGNLTRRTDPLGGVEVFEYDEMSHLIRKVDARGVATEYIRDALGNVLTMTEAADTALARTTTYTYDGIGRLIATTYPDGSATYREYDEVGNHSASVDENGNRTDFGYDEYGRLVWRQDAQGNIVQYAYDATGDLISETDARGGTTTHAYDLAGRRISTTDALGNTTTFTYDAVGNRINEVDALGHATQYEYDALGQQGRLIYPDGAELQSEFDANGRLTASVDAQGGRTEFVFDALSRRVAVANALGCTTTVAHDANDRVVQQTNALGQPTTYTYDANGNLLSETDPLGHVNVNLRRTTCRPESGRAGRSGIKITAEA